MLFGSILGFASSKTCFAKGPDLQDNCLDCIVHTMQTDKQTEHKNTVNQQSVQREARQGPSQGLHRGPPSALNCSKARGVVPPIS